MSVSGAPSLAPRLEPRAITGSSDDYDGLLELVGGSNLVLIGEASHGTHEFYRERARITRRLIEEKGFRAVAVEAAAKYRIDDPQAAGPQTSDPGVA